jgi:hypothetical protein
VTETTITLSPGGPHSPAYTRQVANAAAEAIRVLNHATFQASGGALAHPADVDAVIQALATMHARLPQLYGQLTGWLREQATAGRLQTSHGPYRGDPAAAVAEIAISLQNAALGADAAHEALGMAGQITATISAVGGESGGGS